MKTRRQHSNLRDPEVKALAHHIAQLAALIAGRPRPVVTVESWLSPAELGDLVGRSSTTVRRWIRHRGLAAKRIGPGYIVRHRDFLDWDPDSPTSTIKAEAVRILKRLK